MGVTALADAAAGGALPQLTYLDLNNNLIGDKGMEVFAEACASGALAQLTVRSLSTALSSDPETCHVHSPDPDVLFCVPGA